MKASELDETKKAIIRAMADCNMRISTVARNTAFHRNSVSYHNKQIKEMTGLDPTRFYDLVKLIEELEEQK